MQQAQADLARLNRVMLLGEMTTSIAHEINQPIAAVITNANAGLRWLGARPPDLDEVRETLYRIVRDGTRAGEVIGRIRTLVKKMPPSRDSLDINQAIREVIALTQTEIQRNNISLQSRLADDLALVSADRVQLQQVVINLIVNVIEAMAGVGGGQRELAIVSGLDDALEVFVELQDTGPGLDPEQLDRLFQSFYTTKPDGIGNGIGDQPIDPRGPWRAVMGNPESAPRGCLSIDAAHRRDVIERPGTTAPLAGAGKSRNAVSERAFQRCGQLILKYNRYVPFRRPILPLNGRNRRKCNGESPRGALFLVRVRDRNCQRQSS